MANRFINELYQIPAGAFFKIRVDSNRCTRLSQKQKCHVDEMPRAVRMIMCCFCAVQ